MGTLIAGSVVLVSFPFSDLSKAKKRPAFILAETENNDWILCQITSKSYSSKNVICIDNSDFIKGSLQRKSYVRPEKLFTANQKLIISEVGLLKIKTTRNIIKSVIKIMKISYKLRKKI